MDQFIKHISVLEPSHMYIYTYMYIQILYILLTTIPLLTEPRNMRDILCISCVILLISQYYLKGLIPVYIHEFSDDEGSRIKSVLICVYFCDKIFPHFWENLVLIKRDWRECVCVYCL